MAVSVKAVHLPATQTQPLPHDELSRSLPLFSHNFKVKDHGLIKPYPSILDGAAVLPHTCFACVAPHLLCL